MKFSRLFAMLMLASVLCGTVPAQAGFWDDVKGAFGFESDEQAAEAITRPNVPVRQAAQSATRVAPQAPINQQRGKHGKHGKHNKHQRHVPAQRVPVQPQAQQYAPVRPAAQRRVTMAKEQVKKLKMQRAIRNIAAIAFGAALLYAAERNFNVMDRIRDLLGFSQATKDLRDQGKRVVNTVNDLFFGTDLAGGNNAQNDGTFLGEGFYN